MKWYFWYRFNGTRWNKTEISAHTTYSFNLQGLILYIFKCSHYDGLALGCVISHKIWTTNKLRTMYFFNNNKAQLQTNNTHYLYASLSFNIKLDNLRKICKMNNKWAASQWTANEICWTSFGKHFLPFRWNSINIEKQRNFSLDAINCLNLRARAMKYSRHLCEYFVNF